MKLGIQVALICALVCASAAQAQSTPGEFAPEAAAFIDLARGSSSIDMVRRALSSNRSLAAARSSVQRAQARLLEAGLRPNPSFDIERSTVGREKETVAGVAVPIELGGKRSSRMAIARGELDAARAEFRQRQRGLIRGVLLSYADALAAIRQLDAAAKLNELDAETARFLQIRVNEGEAAPLELKLLQVEVDRLRAQRILYRGRAEAALVQLKQFIGMPMAEDLRLGQTFASEDSAVAIPKSLGEALTIGLRQRPEIALARANEEIARATLSAARAQSVPDIIPFARAGTRNESVAGFAQSDRSVSLGLSLTLPIFNRGQAARAEAGALIEQATREREATELAVRADIESAYLRLQASQAALAVFETGVIQRSAENIRTVRAAYQLGEFRITELIAEQRRLVDSQKEYTELLAEHYRNLADLQIAIGTSFGEESTLDRK